MLFPPSTAEAGEVKPASAFRNRPRTSIVVAVSALVVSTLTITSCGLSTQNPNAISRTASGSKFKFPIMHRLDDKESPSQTMIAGNLPSALVGVSYQATIPAGRATPPYQFLIIAGSLPAGLSVNSATGAISGTPLFVGTSKFVVWVRDATTGEYGGLESLSLTVAPGGSGAPPVSVQISPGNASLSSGGSGQFNATVSETSNVAVIWSATAGTVSPNGLFQAPNVTVATTATITATSVADPSKKASAIATVTPASSKSGPTIISTALPAAVTGTSYSATLVASGGTSPYTWSASSGLPTGLTLDSTSGTIAGTTAQTGSFSFTAKVTDAASHSNTTPLSLSVTSSSSSNFDGPAELPRVYLQTTMADTPTPGNTFPVTAGADLQGALNNANCGDTITLQAGAVFAGAFYLPAKPCDDDHWIIIRTNAPDSSLPAEGTRVTPCYAGVASLPGRPAFNCSSAKNVLAQIAYSGRAGDGPVYFAPGANHYRLLGLEITRLAGTGSIGTLVSAHKGTADHIVIDRSWLHGTAPDETEAGVHLSDTTYVAVVDSFFTDFHCVARTGACTDGKSIGGGNGSNPGGPYKIVNNFLEGSGESIIFGGGPATTTPADIEIRRNHLFKPWQWMPGASAFVGGASGNPFVVKNHFELKNAQRVLFEGNVMENAWGGFSQTGFSILLTPKNQHTEDGTNVCPICQVTDVTIRYSTISHVAGGFQVSTGISGNGTNGGVALAGARFSVHDVTVDDINASRYNGNGTLVQVANSWKVNALNSVTISHITGFTDPSAHLLVLGNIKGNAPMWGFNFTNNIVVAGRFPVWNMGGGPSSCAYPDIPILSLAACFTSYRFSENAVIGAPAAFPPSQWTSGNYFPASPADTQFVNYNEGNGGDYHLLSSSPYKNMGSDGKDLGADIDAIQAAIAGVY